MDTCHGILGGTNHTAVFAGYHASGYYLRGIVAAMHRHTGLKPTIIYFNGGMHLFHLYPAHAWAKLETSASCIGAHPPAQQALGVHARANTAGCRKKTLKSAYAIWNHSEAYLAAFLDDAVETSAKLTPASEVSAPPVLVYMSSHSVCEGKFDGPWRAALVNITSDSSQHQRRALQPCASLLMKSFRVEEEDAYRQCLGTSFSRHGVQKLNARLLNALGTWVQRHPAARVGVVKGFEITDTGSGARCDETKDGRHYHNLVYSELFAMFAAAKAAASAPSLSGPAISATAAATAVLSSCLAKVGQQPAQPDDDRPPAEWPYVFNLGFPKSGSSYVWLHVHVNSHTGTHARMHAQH